VIAVPGVHAACVQPGVASDPAGEVTRGVESIATAGVPGPLAVFGPRAFVIAAGKEGRDSRLPVVAGAVWGRGRVIAFGHGGMIGAEALKHEGTAALVRNGVKWLAGDAARPRVGVVRNDAMAALLSAAVGNILVPTRQGAQGP
jgi:hypothetical protein